MPNNFNVIPVYTYDIDDAHSETKIKFFICKPDLNSGHVHHFTAQMLMAAETIGCYHRRSHGVRAGAVLNALKLTHGNLQSTNFSGGETPDP
jgi:hypothetical protein